MTNLCVDILSIGITLDLASYAGGNVAKSDTVHRTVNSEKHAQFARIATQISFSLMTGRCYNKANSTPFLIFKIVPHDMLLPHYTSYNDFAAV